MPTEKEHHTKKETMVKSRVGCVKSCVHQLPDANHTYGAKRIPDIEGAGAGALSNQFLHCYINI